MKSRIENLGQRISNYVRRIYRLSLNIEKQEQKVWQDLKKLHEDLEWKCGIYESDKHIRTVFEIGEEIGEVYYYFIHDNYFYCSVKVLDNFPVEITTDAFVLATHFNNLLSRGSVTVDTDACCVTYQSKEHILIPLLYKGELHEQMIRHINTAKDIYWAFQRLVKEQEAPAIIIADLLRKNERSQTTDN